MYFVGNNLCFVGKTCKICLKKTYFARFFVGKRLM